MCTTECESEVAFTVTRQDEATRPLLGPNDIVWLLDLGGTDIKDRFNLGTDTFTVPSDGIYFTVLCAGFATGKTAELRTTGGATNIGMIRRSTAHDNRDSQCRSGMQLLQQGETIKVRNDGEESLSDTQYQTQWSTFSVSDSMGDSNAFAASLRTDYSTLGNVIFDNVYVNENNVFDAGSGEYTCPETGVYFFDVSIGLPAGTLARIQIRRSLTAPRDFELTRTSTAHNSLDTLGRSALITCEQGEKVSLNLLNGQLVGDNTDMLTAFSGFRYSPCKGVSVAWAAYRDSVWAPADITRKLDPVTFSSVLVNVGGAFANNMATLPVSGYYYLYMSSGAERSKRVNVDLYVTKADIGVDSVYADIFR